MSLDDAATDEETEAEPRGFRSHERHEHAMTILDRDAVPEIPDGQLHFSRPATEPGPHDDPALSRGFFLHRLACVHDQVENHLLNLHPISLDQAKRGRQIGPELNLAP